MNDLISVLMCVYNTPLEYLKEAVESIRNQTYNNLEFVIVDDASDQEDVIRYLDSIKHEDDRIKLIRNKVNLGLTKSLNVGLPYCKGKYIARMDSDDISMSERLRKQAEFMESHPDSALVGSSIITFGEGIEEKDESLCEDACDDPEVYRIRSLIRHSGPPHPTFMFRSEFLRDNGIKYREDILKAQDYGIMVDIMKKHGEIRRISEPLLKYRIHKGQITSGFGTEQKANQWKVSYDYIKWLFPELTEGECLAVSSLGCDPYDEKLIRSFCKINTGWESGFLLPEKIKQLNRSSCYIKAVKRIIVSNRKIKQFDSDKLEMILRYELWKKSIRMTRSLGRPWGMWPYTVSGYRFVIGVNGLING